jgi:rhamnosyltransferase
MDNLLSSPGQIMRILELFATDRSLGMVIPPLVHIGYPTLGHAWFSNREPAKALAEELGIAVPFDYSTPIAAIGGWFWARPQALAKLTARDFRFDDFAVGPDGYRDGQLPHVLERLYAYAALAAGYAVRAVANTRWIAIDYAFLEYKLQRLSQFLPADMDQVEYIIQLQDYGRELARTREQLALATEELNELRSANVRRRRARAGSGRSWS